MVNTYCQGFSLEVARPVSCFDISALCASLEHAFGPGHRFHPEGITEGGIYWRDYPGRADGSYKTMRIHTNCRPWPWVTASGQWRTGTAPDRIVFKPTGSSDAEPGRLPPLFTFLKALNGAAPWTEAELVLFAQCLGRVGLLPVPGSWPTGLPEPAAA